jgi:hypothetical protein
MEGVFLLKISVEMKITIHQGPHGIYIKKKLGAETT